MSLEIEDIKKIAHLARIDITNKNQEELLHNVADLNKIFNWVDQMQSVNTDDIDPMAHPMATTQRVREDVATEKDEHQALQQIAPKTEADLYLVPTVIE